ncbi:DEAD/DEAH box helicase family protein [Oceanispirochaeta sp. M1]|uniref:TOTE conflict system archaeo-eukaryotic primase domain-containing protein n=2 Tax=Oceanispirochaeta TaxID=2035349 RepID=UPI0020A61F9D|nr:DEAD/DEAH box helicase [Oceanispirochaeta sp. M1]
MASMEMDKITSLKAEISSLEMQLSNKKTELKKLLSETSSNHSDQGEEINNISSPDEKIKLFRSLFSGRDDVYAKRFESAVSGQSGYQPACQNEWKEGICEKPKIKCASCLQRQFIPVSDEIISFHLKGEAPPEETWRKPKPFVMGIYPLLPDETCRFLALDFDKENWQQDVQTFLETCSEEGIPASLERSRSGNGGHVWIFFNEAIQARQARNLGSMLLTKSLDNRPEIGLDSFDRFFPNQDTMPRGGFGNLIALPLQKMARQKKHSVFINEDFQPFEDQWSFLSSIQKMSRHDVDNYLAMAMGNQNSILPVSHDQEDENLPWMKSSKSNYPPIETPLPVSTKVILSNQIFLDYTGLPPILRNRILRLASFSNPEFYKAQAMRLPTWNKPRILHCYEQKGSYIALPIGCLDALKKLLEHYKIKLLFEEKRNKGKTISCKFQGALLDEQQRAAEVLTKYNTGVLSATTAFGKTVLALWLIAERGVNTLVLVHRKQLMDQWVQRAQQFLDLSKKEIGCFGGGRKKRTGILDIAVIQSVSRKGEIVDWLDEYGQIIVDECHHISAVSFEQAIRQSPAYYKLGLSATLTRKDGQHPIIFMNLGDVRYSVSAKKQAATRSFTHKVIPRETDFHVDFAESASDRIQDLFRILAGDESRNDFILSDIKNAIFRKQKILVITERKEHLEQLSKKLKAFTDNLFILQGGLGKKQIKAVMQGIEKITDDQDIVILATGRYLGEGFDLPFLETLFLTFPVSWKGTLTQYAGRLHREYHGKEEVMIYDYVDAQVPVLSRMFQKRIKGYKALGYTIKDS